MYVHKSNTRFIRPLYELSTELPSVVRAITDQFSCLYMSVGTGDGENTSGDMWRMCFRAKTRSEHVLESGGTYSIGYLTQRIAGV